MSWPLTTTGDRDLDSLIVEILDLSHPRKFLWTHCTREQDRSIDVKKCQLAGLVVLDQVPCWFLLACAKHVLKRDRCRMMQSIITTAGHEAWWRGKMFGYPAKDINWFQTEIYEAMKRIEEYQRGL